MTDYYPDKWVVIEIKTPDTTIQKVLASWYGGFAGSDSWRCSSGITDIETLDDRYLFHNESGSIYECFKHRYGMSAYTAIVYQHLIRDLPNDTTIKIVEDYDHASISE